MKSLTIGLSLLVVCSACAAEMAQLTMVIPPPPVLSAEALGRTLVPQSPAVRRVIDARALIRAAALKHRVPAAFLNSIVAAESNFNCDAISPKGAIGLMQLMPATARHFGADPTDPEQNVDAGTRYLRLLIDKYHGYKNWLKRVIAAYNAGPAVVDRFHGVPPYPETRTYVARVLAFLRQFQRQQG